MGSAVGRLVLNEAAITAMTGPDGLMAQDLVRRGNRVVNRARQLVGVDKGPLRASIAMQPVRREGNLLVVQIGSNLEYAMFHHEGTGVYGRGSLIRPVRAQALRWKAGKGGGGTKGYVFSKYSRGSRPNPFLRDALPAAAG